MRLTCGNGSKNGPIKSMTNDKNPHDTMLANWVRPPAVSWIKLLDNEAQNGGHEKKDPKIFAVPYNNNWPKNIYN